ncbi:MAG: HAMP domain-containing histidine kinase [Bacteroidales bacterium]|nr:HAMP domain-containing histidine kinase [Bacteroidales bacterium]
MDEGQLDEDSKSNLKLVKKNVSRLLNLTNQLLELRKVDIGILEPRYEKVIYVNYIKEILDYFEQQAKRKSINLVFNTKHISGSEELWIDKEMITTAIYNLLSNAFKFTNKGGLVNVTLEKTDLSKIPEKEITKSKIPIKHWLLIEIADNGIGIPAKDLANIFHRFYQGSNHLISETPGSGIGLSIVKEYVDLHFGVIMAESKVGSGTVIKVYLPLGNDHIHKKHIREYHPISIQTKDIIDKLPSAHEELTPLTNGHEEQKKAAGHCHC